jgi:hypothetical protein
MAAAKPRVQRTPRRRDPQLRPNQFIDWTCLKNKDPGRVYVWAASDDDAFGVGYYASRGYQTEIQHEEPETVSRVQGRNKPGSPIETMGHTLMSIDYDSWKDGYDNGGNGGLGQRIGDVYENAIVKNKGFKDPQRGINGPVWTENVNDEEDLRRLGLDPEEEADA